MERPVVLGRTVDDQTRCAHYHGPTDVIAIKFACCGAYYPCFECRREAADHPARQWPADRRDQKAILCGVCGTELPIATYQAVTACPACDARFNERCRLHWPRYFQASVTPADSP